MASREKESDYIVPEGKHPGNAIYVAKDKKSGAEVSFDQWGRRLDSIGNVVAESRQRAGDAGAKIIAPKQQQAPEQKQYTDGGYGSKLTNMLAPGRTQQQTVAPQRSSWDNSVIPNVMGPQRGNNPNTLAPGGRDNSFLGMPYPTARNGLVGSQWARPWTGQQQPPPMSPPPQQQSAPSYNPLPQESWRAPSQVEQFMVGGNQYSPVQPKVNIPGFGQLPAADPVGQQDYNRNLDVSAYLPGGAMYNRPAYQPQDLPIPMNNQFDPYRP